MRAKPALRARLRLAVVHHTAGTNTYTPAQAAAIVRGIEVYHVQGNGWNDIGYNFLVDRFGTVYEGRGGGIDEERDRRARAGLQHGHGRHRADRQLHERDAAAGDAGRARRAARLAARRRAHRPALDGRLHLGRQLRSSRPARSSRCGRSPVTATPGRPSARATTRTRCCRRSRSACRVTGLPKLYSPTVAGALGGDVRFQAPLSRRRCRGRSRSPTPLGKTVAPGTRPRPARRLDVELAGAGSGPLHLDDRRAGRAARRRGRSALGPPAPPPPAPLSLDEPAPRCRRSIAPAGRRDRRPTSTVDVHARRARRP